MDSAGERSSKYAWTPTSGIGIDDYLKKVRPSIITDEDAEWIWVRSGSDQEDPEDGAGQAKAIGEGKRLLDDLERRLKRIEEDESIPVRAKKGVKSKKAVRDETYAEVTADLKALSKEHKWTGGKWLLFPGHETVDGIWATLARSVANGPLREAGVTLAKVAPTPSQSSEGDHKPHLICLYIEDVYDLNLVRKVLEVLLTQHGIEPSSVKSDLYTLVGIDSSHSTKLRSTIWRPAEVIEGGVEAIKSLKAKYKPRQHPTSTDDPSGPKMIDDDSEDERTAKAIKRKAVSDEPEGAKSTAQDVKAVAAAKHEPATKNGKTSNGTAPLTIARDRRARYKEEDIFAGPEDDSD